METHVSELKDLIAESKRVVAFTGAGLSAESGIPTYRGEGGMWTKYDPNKYANIDYFMENPKYYWEFFRDVRYPVISKAQPNGAHHALAELEKHGKLKTVITQNIDGLHQGAGQENVIELHGNTRRIMCLDCGKEHTMDEAFEMLRTQLPPKCACSGALKPDVVFFGESLPMAALDGAGDAALNCDCFLAIGSSLVVMPAAQFPVIAKRNGAKLAIINLGNTPLDDMADVLIEGKAAEVLHSVVHEM
jgi:NAD-dependent deacetylase